MDIKTINRIDKARDKTLPGFAKLSLALLFIVVVFLWSYASHGNLPNNTFLIIGAVFLVAAIIVWIVFGKRIRKHFAVKRLLKKHTAFISMFDQSIHKLNQTFNPDVAESSITIWKKYMEEISARPYTKFTSKEIRELEKGELTVALQAVDKMIYARLKPESLSAFEQLKEFTINRFNQKLQEVKHG